MKVPRRLVAIEIRQGTSPDFEKKQLSYPIRETRFDPTLGYFQRTSAIWRSCTFLLHETVLLKFVINDDQRLLLRGSLCDHDIVVCALVWCISRML